MNKRMAQPRRQTTKHGFLIRISGPTTRKHNFRHDVLPLIPVQNELVLEEVDPRALVLALAEEVAVVVQGDFAGGVAPGFEAFGFEGVFIDFVQLVRGRIEDVGRAEELEL